jgi:signal transduction histidine kinase/HAMP domain-containing protein
LKAPKLSGSVGLTYRLVIYILVVAIVPVVLIALFAFRTGSQGIQRHTSLHLESVVTERANGLERWFRPLEAAARVLASNSQLRDNLGVLLNGADSDEARAASDALLRQFKDVVQRNTGLQHVGVMSADRNILLVSVNSSATFAVPNAVPLPNEPTSDLKIYLPPYVEDRRPVPVTIINPVRIQGELVAYLILQASPGLLFEKLTSDPGLGPNGKIYLINQRGEILSPHHRPETGPAITQVAALGEMDKRQLASGLRYRDFLGADVMGAYMPIGSLGWAVVAELPAQEAFSEINKMRWAILGASAIFAVMILAAAMLISRHVTRPLRTLMLGAQEVGRGQLDHRIEVASNDELGELARSFNQMAADLQTAQKRMVEAERATALQAFTEQKVEQLKQLSRLGLLIAMENSLDGLVREMPQMTRDITRADMAALVLFKEGESRVEHAGHTEIAGSDGLERLLQSPELLAHLLAHHSIESGASKANGVCATQACPAHVPQLGGVLAVPIHAEAGDIAGALVIANASHDGRGGFETHPSPEDRELVQIVSGYVSAAVQKLRKESRLQRSEQTALEALEELRMAQAQLLQSQKMESIGKLAGGVAHDFNNLLTPILGYAQLGIMGLKPGEERLRPNLVEIQKAAERASNLTRQLLGFSRRQIIEPKVLNLNTLIQDMDKMLRRLIGEDIELVTQPAQDLWLVKIDPGQVEQVLMNLVVNARDAMPNGGKVTVETFNAVLDPEYCASRQDVTPGDYAVLAVSDNGTGMSDEVKAHLFEPFFTTKEKGKGTGLGLATCYGIVKQNQGHIAVYSEVGQGTTFRIYLPRVNEAASAPTIARQADTMPRGTETVLLVEDEPAVRDLAVRVLREQGYTVLDAPNGAEALRIAHEHDGRRIDLLLTDVVMPLMSGSALAEQLRAAHPEIKVLFASGYTDEAIVRHGVLSPGVTLIQKPFTPATLALKVRQVLDEPARTPA